MSDLCGCAYPAGCGGHWEWTKECQDAFLYNSSAIRSNCNLQCPSECTQVSFPINRVDVEGDIPDWMLDKPKILAKFNITGQNVAEIKKRIIYPYIYFGKLETD